MFTLFMNFICAAAMSVVMIGLALKEPWRWEAQRTIYIVVAPIWLAGAIGLMVSINRWAWCASFLGISTMLCSSLVMVVSALVLFPVGQDPTDGIGYTLIFGFVGVLLSLPVFIGVFLLRRKSFGRSGDAS